MKSFARGREFPKKDKKFITCGRRIGVERICDAGYEAEKSF
jgi:hypothetical protein